MTDRGGWVGWDRQGTLAFPEVLVARDDEEWVTWPGSGLQGRDLRLSELSGGRLSGMQVRATGADAHGGDWHCYDLDFEFVYVLAGSLVLETRDGEVHELRAGSSFCHPAFFWHRDVFRAGDLDVVRITSPAVEERFDGLEAVLPAALPLSGSAAVYTHPPDPRDTNPAIRDLGAARQTGGRIQLQVVRPGEVASRGGEQVLPAHWSFVLDGTAENFTVLELRTGV